VKPSKSERKNVNTEYFQGPVRINYDWHLFVLSEVFKNRSKNKIGFGKIPSIQGSPPLIDLNYVVFQAKTVNSFASDICKGNPSCLYKPKDITEILSNAEDKVKIRPKKVLQYVDEQSFKTSIESWLDGMRNGHVNPAHIIGTGAKATCLHPSCSVFKDIVAENGKIPINPHAPDMTFDYKSVPAVKIVPGEVTEIWIHLDVIYRRHRVDDLTAALASLNALCKNPRVFVVPTPEGVDTVKLKGHGKSITAIDISRVRKNKETSRWLDELEARNDSLLPNLPPKAECTRSAEYRRQIQTQEKLLFDEDIDDYFSNIRLESYGIWTPRVPEVSTDDDYETTEIITLAPQEEDEGEEEIDRMVGDVDGMEINTPINRERGTFPPSPSQSFTIAVPRLEDD
jgi:hypothetical protein